MKNLAPFLIFPFLFLLSCQDKNQNKNGVELNSSEVELNDTIKPQTKIEVHKEYDEQGNLISIDSTYSYFYSNIKNDTILENEIFQKFKLDFDMQFIPIDSLFMQDFFNDTPFKLDNFYTDDFFEKSFKRHQKHIQNMYRRMDSIKNSYYKKQFPIEED